MSSEGERWVAFVRARLAEDEAAAKALEAAFAGTEWMITENGDFDFSVTAGQLSTEAVADTWREDAAAWIARHDPARTLRQVEYGAPRHQLLGEPDALPLPARVHAGQHLYQLEGEPGVPGMPSTYEPGVQPPPGR